MVAACPSCEARYRVDVSRLPADGARLRCSRCETVFRVRAPAGDPVAPAPAAPVVKTPAQHVEAAPAPRPAPPAPVTPEVAPPPGEAERDRLVLVAHPDVEDAKAIADALTSWGLDVRLAHDGVEAILGIQRSLPKLVVLDAALPKMFGFQVCELVKRNESLRDIAVVLVGAIHHEDRYRRPPGELYGADAYLERQQIPEGLIPLMRDLGLDRRRSENTAEPLSAPSPAPQPAPSPPEPRRSVSEPVAPRPPVAGSPPVAAPPPEPLAVAPSPPQVDALPPPPAVSVAPNPEMATAERLARIIVSDIVLYNAERFEAAVGQGEVVRAMAAELQEGKDLLSQRVGGNVDVAGLLENELLRVARARGMR